MTNRAIARLVLILAIAIFGLSNCREETSQSGVANPVTLAAIDGDGSEPRPEPVGPAITVDPAFDPLSRALYALETGRRGRVEILQLGDSHTAADGLTGRLRDLLQQRFGSAGRGLLPVGVPYAGFRPTEVTVSQSGRWAYENSFSQSAIGPFGITGFLSRTQGPDSAVSLSALDPAGFDEVVVEYLTVPGGGGFTISVDGSFVRRVATNGGRIVADRISLAVPGGSRQLTLKAEGSEPVAFLSWTVDRRRGGVVLDSEGIVGATVNILDRWSPEIVRSELARRDSALIILAFGTNEGFGRGIDEADYASGLRTKVAELRAMAPRSAILLIGPPDGNRILPRCTRRQRSDCRRSAEPLAGGLAACRAATPGGLAQVREVDRRVAASERLFYWDWSEVMGTPCGIHRWTQTIPPLAREDHIHLTPDGYRASAEVLFKEMMAQYERYRAAAGAVRVSAADPSS